MSLTTVTGVEEAAVRHYCESLFLGARLTPGLVADIGSGPGFPGIPAAILRADCHFDLVESNQRKAVFLREASRGMPNVRVLATRAENLKAPYDWIAARAVDPGVVLALKVARRYAMLIGAEDAARIGRAEIAPLPWGDRRVLCVVSRGTDGLIPAP